MSAKCLETDLHSEQHYSHDNRIPRDETLTGVKNRISAEESLKTLGHQSRLPCPNSPITSTPESSLGTNFINNNLNMSDTSAHDSLCASASSPTLNRNDASRPKIPNQPIMTSDITSETLKKNEKNPISALQEHCVQRGLGLPTYTEAGMMGPPHARLFRMRVMAAGFVSEGSGMTKKAAKIEAARDTLYKIRQEHGKNVSDGISIVNMTGYPAIAQCAYEVPDLESKLLNTMTEPAHRSSSRVALNLQGSTSRDRLTDISQLQGEDGMITLASVMASISLDDPALDQEVVQKLYALCGKNGFSFPEYAEISTEGMSHCPTFRIAVSIQSLNLKAEGVGKNKIGGKRIAATNMMKKLKELYPHVCDIAKAKIITNTEEDINRRLKYRIPGDKYDNPIIVFELFRLLEETPIPEFELIMKAKGAGDTDYDFFDILSQVCGKLSLSLQSFENDCIKCKKVMHESVVILTYKEIPILTSYGTSFQTREAALNQASYRASIGLYASKNPS